MKTEYFKGHNTCKIVYPLPKVCPDLNDWVYVEGYIDFSPKQKELARVKFENGQLVLHGYARYGKWKETEFTLAISNSKGSIRKYPFEFKKIGQFTWTAKYKGPIKKVKQAKKPVD